MPGYEVIPVSPISTTLVCSLCRKIFKDPVKIASCRHTFCDSCLQGHLARGVFQCPEDKSLLDYAKVFPNTEVQSAIMSTMIRCIHHKDGCRWVDKLQKLQVHLESSCRYNLVQCPKDCGCTVSRQALPDHLEYTCPQRRIICESCGIEFTGAAMETHQGNCPHEVVWCENKCGAQLQRRYLDNHTHNECHKRTIACPHCSKQFMCETLQNHFHSCLRLPVLCPNRCEVGKVAREDLDLHVRETCSALPVCCQYKYAGCKYMCTRQSMERHLQDHQSQHLSLVSDLVAKQQLTIRHLTSRLDCLCRNTDGVLLWRVDSVQQHLDRLEPPGSRSEPVELKSEPFYSSQFGYKMSASLFLGGHGSGEGTHLSLYIRMLPGEYDNLLHWPFRQTITFRLRDQCSSTEKRQDLVESFVPNPNWKQFQKPGKDCEVMGFGYPRFIAHDFLKHGTYVKDDVMFVQITVEPSAKYIMTPAPGGL